MLSGQSDPFSLLCGKLFTGYSSPATRAQHRALALSQLTKSLETTVCANRKSQTVKDGKNGACRQNPTSFSAAIVRPGQLTGSATASSALASSAGCERNGEWSAARVVTLAPGTSRCIWRWLAIGIVRSSVHSM